MEKTKHVTAHCKVQDAVLLILLSVFAAGYVEKFKEARAVALTGEAAAFSWPVFGVSFGIFFVLLLVFFRFHLLHLLERWRYGIALVLLITGVALSLSGSSLACWTLYFPDTDEDLPSGLLFGIPRLIRTDEWSLFTPMNLSQQWTGYSDVSDILRGTATDVTTTYGLASFCFVTLFRPFLWGYLVLGAARGLSFYWCARVLVLFLVSYDCGRLLFQGRKRLAALYATLLTFSPVIAWWYSTNALLEMFLFGQACLLVLDRYLRETRTLRKVLLVLLLAWCMVCYAVTFYPGQEIPLLYVFLILGVSLLIRAVRSKSFVFHRTDALCLGLLLAVVGASLAVIFHHSEATIEALSETVYPGQRTLQGGDYSFRSFFDWPLSLWYPVDTSDLSYPYDICDAAAFTSFFPLGSLSCLLLLIRPFRGQKRDGQSAALLVLEAVFILFCCAGFPEAPAKVTLLSSCLATRLAAIVGYVELLLLFLGLSHFEEAADTGNLTAREKHLVIGGNLIVVLCTVLCSMHGHTMPGHISEVLLLVAALCGAAGLFLRRAAQSAAAIGVISILPALLVNPVQQGISCVTDLAIYQDVRSLVEQDPDALWVVTDLPAAGASGDFPIMCGAKTINSTNIYPNLSLWEKVDQNQDETDDYNRYMHVTVSLFEEKQSEDFVLQDAPDAVVAQLTVDDLKTLGVTYVLSRVSYEGTQMADSLELVAGDNFAWIYRIRE